MAEFKRYMAEERGWREAVGLVICFPEGGWSEFPKTIGNEVTNTDMERYITQMGVVVKTEKRVRIPVSAICAVIYYRPASAMVQEKAP